MADQREPEEILRAAARLLEFQDATSFEFGIYRQSGKGYCEICDRFLLKRVGIGIDGFFIVTERFWHGARREVKHEICHECYEIVKHLDISPNRQ